MSPCCWVSVRTPAALDALGAVVSNRYAGFGFDDPNYRRAPLTVSRDGSALVLTSTAMGAQHGSAPAENRARMTQIMSMTDSYAYRPLVWDVYVERVSKPKRGAVADEARIAAALPVAETCLAELERLRGDGPWLAGNRLSLADLHAAPMFSYFLEAEEGRALLAAHAGLGAWWKAVSALPSFVATRPAG